MAVRSRLLGIRSQVTSGSAAVLCDTPVGRTAIIRHWSVTNRSGEPLVVTVNVRSGAIAATLRRVAALQADATTQEANANLCLGPG